MQRLEPILRIPLRQAFMVLHVGVPGIQRYTARVLEFRVVVRGDVLREQWVGPMAGGGEGEELDGDGFDVVSCLAGIGAGVFAGGPWPRGEELEGCCGHHLGSRGEFCVVTYWCSLALRLS